MPRCTDMCGNVRILYPFGIREHCSINSWCVVECNSSTPYLSALNHQLQILGVDLENGIVTVNTPTVTTTLGCPNHVHQDIKSIDLDDQSPFWFSSDTNKLVLEGCGNVVLLDSIGNVISGCSASCANDMLSRFFLFIAYIEVFPYRRLHRGFSFSSLTSFQWLVSHIGDCSYGVKLIGGDKPCKSAFFVDKNSYGGEGSFGNISDVVPVSLLWTLSDELEFFRSISCCYSSERRTIVMSSNGTELLYFDCGIFSGDEGNQYLKDGCVVKEECARCHQNGGYCDYSSPNQVLNCTYYPPYDINPTHKLSLGVILDKISPLPAGARSSLVQAIGYGYWCKKLSVNTRNSGTDKTSLSYDESMPPTLKIYFTRFLKKDTTAKKTWDRLSSIFHDNQGSRAVALEQKFINIKLENFPNVSAYCQAVKMLAGQMNNVGLNVTNQRMVLQLIAGLGSSYSTIGTYISQAEKLPEFYEARSKLILEETRQNRNFTTSDTNSRDCTKLHYWKS
ncbi:wall-associated receptor kinase-like 5 [Rutidosis leptorrhynchoides]|uniref:wall-associated receptor kinase-like 5 n=1 Tax=Rutidosis leptorrhynchoides TaxID=125765 RepID=UPI003A99931B